MLWSNCPIIYAKLGPFHEFNNMQNICIMECLSRMKFTIYNRKCTRSETWRASWSGSRGITWWGIGSSKPFRTRRKFTARSWTFIRNPRNFVLLKGISHFMFLERNILRSIMLSLPTVRAHIQKKVSMSLHDATIAGHLKVLQNIWDDSTHIRLATTIHDKYVTSWPGCKRCKVLNRSSGWAATASPTAFPSFWTFDYWLFTTAFVLHARESVGCNSH